MQYVNSSGNTEVKFLGIKDVLQAFDSCNAAAITATVIKELEDNHLNLEKLNGLATDGASVMLGKHNGVAAKLKEKAPALVNVHCVCHKLALACVDSVSSLNFIKNVETMLRQLWQWFENSPKRMAALLSVQVNVKASKNLSEKAAKILTKRMKKACSTRWLSLDRSVQAVKHEYESLLQVMNMFQESDAVACGFLKKLQQMKFFGTIYILAEILPILSELSKVFQAGKFNFSSIAPAIAKAEAELEDLKSKGTAIEKLQKDVESLEYISVRIKITPSSLEELVKIQEKYIDILVENINKRFESIKQNGVPSALAIFDPIAVPDTNDSSFKEYGQDQIKVLAAHFFTEISCEKLLSEWSQMKYHINENIMKAVPEKIRKGKSKITPTGWFLTEIMRQKVTYEPFLVCFLSWPKLPPGPPPDPQLNIFHAAY